MASCSLNRIRAVCNFSAVFLLVAGIILLLVAVLTPFWLRAQQTTAVFSDAQRRDRHTVGLIEDCLVTNKYAEPNVCETKLRWDGDETYNQYSASRWRRQVLLILIAALFSAFEAFQLGLCALHLKVVSVIWTFFCVAAAILVLSAILVFDDAVGDLYFVGVDSNQVATDTLRSNINFFTNNDSDQYVYGYSYWLCVWACAILFVAALASGAATVLAVVGNYQKNSRSQRLSIYDIRRFETD